MVELFDWHNQKGEARGAGFLVAGIKSEEGYRLPAGFETKEQKAARKSAVNSRIRVQQELNSKAEAKRAEQEKAEQGRFQAFYEALPNGRREEFEKLAMSKANRMTLRLFTDAEKKSSPVAEVYRQSILMEHYRSLEPTQHTVA